MLNGLNKIIETGISEKLKIFDNKFLKAHTCDVEDKLNEVSRLNKEKKKNDKIIDKLINEIVYDKKLSSLGSDEYFEDVYKPIFMKVLETNKIEKYNNVPFAIRINIPNYKYFHLHWHQDSGTFIYNKKNDIFDYKSFALWTAITETNNENGIDLIPRNQHQEKIYNACHTISASRRPPFNYRVLFGKSSLPRFNKLITTNNFKSGEGILFDSLVFHRSCLNKTDNIRLSFDVRFYCPEERFKIKKFGTRNSIKRFFYKNLDVKIPYL